jgi:hypothetical protein
MRHKWKFGWWGEKNLYLMPCDEFCHKKDFKIKVHMISQGIYGSILLQACTLTTLRKQSRARNSSDPRHSCPLRLNSTAFVVFDFVLAFCWHDL